MNEKDFWKQFEDLNLNNDLYSFDNYIDAEIGKVESEDPVIRHYKLSIIKEMAGIDD